MKKYFLLLTLFLCNSMAWAHDVEVDGIYYNLDQKNNTASVTYNDANKYTGSLVVPESISVEGTTYVVTSISYIENCFDLTSIIIPNTVTSVGTFYNCYGLTSITIPNSVTHLGGFDHCTGLTSITIPNSVTYLGSFWGCTGLTSVFRAL